MGGEARHMSGLDFVGNRDFRLSGLVFGASVRAVHNSIQLAVTPREHEDTSDSVYARNCASNAVHVAILQTWRASS